MNFCAGLFITYGLKMFANIAYLNTSIQNTNTSSVSFDVFCGTILSGLVMMFPKKQNGKCNEEKSSVLSVRFRVQEDAFYYCEHE